MITICRLSRSFNSLNPSKEWKEHDIVVSFLTVFNEYIIGNRISLLHNLQYTGSTLMHSSIDFLTLENYIINDGIPLKIDYLGSYIKATAIINQTLTEEIMSKDKSSPAEVTEEVTEVKVVADTTIMEAEVKFAYIIEIQTNSGAPLTKDLTRQVVVAESKAKALTLFVNKMESVLIERVCIINIKEKLPLLNQ